MNQEDADVDISSTATLAAVLASEATGRSVGECHSAVQAWLAHARADGTPEVEIMRRLTPKREGGRANVHERRRWVRLVEQFGPRVGQDEEGGI